MGRFRAASSSSSGNTTTGLEWRQRQLQKLEEKFESSSAAAAIAPPSQSIEKEEDVQQMWREMEGRVTRRRPRTVEENGGKTGRCNIKRTDEEVWQQEGLYDDIKKQPS